MSAAAAVAHAAPAPWISVAPATLRLQRRCACGGNLGLDGMCDACRARTLGRKSALAEAVAASGKAALRAHQLDAMNVERGALKPKLIVGPAGDRFEEEADRVSDEVVRREAQPESAAGAGSPTSALLLRRDRGDESRPGEDTGLDRSFETRLHDARSTGQLLPGELRGSMERAFQTSFGDVRIHADPEAAELSRSIGASAFTHGRHIYFDAHRFDGTSRAGRRLLAHELTHTIQQTGGAAAVQRKVVVGAPGAKPAAAPAGRTNESIAKDYVTKLCSDFNVTGAVVAPTDPAFCPGGVAASAAPEACGCLCRMTGLADTWTIVINDGEWPHTDDATRTVSVPSPFSGVEMGSWARGSAAPAAPAPHRTIAPNWLVLGHELCGHADLMARGIHPGPRLAPPAGARATSHDPTVKVENLIASEHGIPPTDLRGLEADPHHGESLGRITVGGFATGASGVAGLAAADKAKIALAATFVTSFGGFVDIVGHTDGAGAAADNATLSKNRADAVQAELVRLGVPAASFRGIRGAGSAECPAAGASAACRKVEIFMFPLEAGSETKP